MSNCQDWVIREAMRIPYGHPKRTVKQACRKVLNTILSHWAYTCPINSLRILFHRWRGCHIGKGVYIGRYCFLDNMYPEYIYICDGASVNADSMILTHFNPFETWKNVFAAEVKPTIIGENAIVAVRCTIMPGITIGKYAVVSSGITVDKDVREYTICSLKQEIKQVNIKPLMK